MTHSIRLSVALSKLLGRSVARYTLVFAAVGIVAATLGATDAAAANGCGPGGSDWRTKLKAYVVADAPFSFSFQNACNSHDLCYGVKWNRVASSYQAAKAKCDSQFYADLTRGCYIGNSGGTTSLFWQWCQYTAYGYYKAVYQWGGGPYSSAQTNVRR